MKIEELNETNSALDPQAIDELFQNLGTAEKPVRTKQDVSNTNGSAVAPVRRPSYQPAPTRHSAPIDSEGIDWVGWFYKLVMVAGCAPLVILLLTSFSWSPFRDHPAAQPIRKVVTERRVITRDIEDFDVGMRSLGTNPLRDQVETAPEPDPETSRKLVLRMKKESGRNLFIKLLRSLAWIEAIGAEEGGTFFLDLPEMGAVGDAYVEALLPCPPIEKGRGNVVTGTFAHEADPDTKILSVTFANGAHIKGVTDNHPFYSVDRHAFVEIGEMRQGDTVKVNGGTTRITKLTSRFAYPGEMLYNLETHNQHVYQVTTAGILVHNNCLGNNLRKAGSYGDIGADAHHIVALSHRGASPARSVLRRHGIDINDAMNGAWLPRNSTVSRARGALHHEAGSALTNRTYLNEVNRRILAADTAGGRAHVLRELQKIRHDLLNGTFPGVQPNF